MREGPARFQDLHTRAACTKVHCNVEVPCQRVTLHRASLLQILHRSMKLVETPMIFDRVASAQHQRPTEWEFSG
eukprot:2081204-Amphidinium_carterae.1